MTLDREQIRRDAEDLSETLLSWIYNSDAETEHLPSPDDLARHCLALLAELEQAEKERDDFGPLFVRDCCRILGIDENDHLRMDKIGARLAKVPALVEALTKVTSVARKFAAAIEGEYGPAEYPADLADLEVIVDAEAVIAAWESE